MAKQAFAGLRVVEVGSGISAPYVGKVFADLGAEVIKVEPPEGDAARGFGPFPDDVPHPEKSGMFLYLNTSKLGVTLNLRSAAARGMLRSLLEQADVFVENNPPAAMEELGLTYERLSELNERLVMTSVTPFGQSGPYRDYRSSPLVSYALGGTAYSTPTGGVGEDRLESYPPVMAWGWNAEFIAAFNASWATMVALAQRRVTGTGAHVDVSEMESGAATERGGVAEAFLGELEPGWSRLKRVGSGSGQIYEASDGYAAIGALDDHQWARWRTVMGDPEWAQSEVFATLSSRRDNADVLHAMATEWTRQHSKDEIYRSIQEGMTIAFPVYTPAEVVDDPHNQARELMVEQEHPVAGPVRFLGAPFHMSETPWRLGRPAPQLGEHNREIFCERLGYTPADLTALRQRGEI